MTTVTQTRIKIRSAGNKDIPAILRLESAHGEGIWTKEELWRVLNRSQEVVTVVATRGGRIVGMLMYELHKKKYDVVALVCEDGDLEGIGKCFVNYMINTLSVLLKGRIMISVRESDLKMQLFLRDHYFRCIRIDRNWYRDYIPGTGTRFEDGYRFKYETKNEDLH